MPVDGTLIFDTLPAGCVHLPERIRQRATTSDAETAGADAPDRADLCARRLRPGPIHGQRDNPSGG